MLHVFAVSISWCAVKRVNMISGDDKSCVEEKPTSVCRVTIQIGAELC